jgi:sugar/nucleoside kinase (ribokinase family)
MAEVLCAGLLVADVSASPLEALPAPGALSLIDRYVTNVGGCAANTAADLCRLGRTASVMGKVGDDLFGKFVLNDLATKGVETSLVRVSKECRTSFTFMLNVSGQDRRYVHCLGANADFSLADIAFDALAGATVLYVGGFYALPGLGVEALATLLGEAKRRGVLTVVDVVIPAGSRVSVEDLRNVLPLTDLFLPNNDEARMLTGRSEPIEQAEILAAAAPQCTAVITLGRGGAVIRRGGEVWRAGAYPITAVDESGCGDAFDAGYIVGLLEGWPFERTVRFASAVGASCAGALGCHAGVLTLEETEAFISGNPWAINRIS